MTSRSVLLFLLACQAALLAGCDSQPGAGDSQPEVLGATESSRDFGDYVVHFNALTTDQLAPEIAREHSIVRSPSRAMLNINIQRKTESGTTTAAAGTVEASALNLTGQLSELLIREIREADSIYYIAEMPVIDSEAIIFTVTVTPEGETSPFTLRFQKQFFID